MYTACKSIKKSQVLTVHGTADTVIPLRDGHVIHVVLNGTEEGLKDRKVKAAAEGWAKGKHEICVIEGSGHNFNDQPTHREQMIEAVVRFVKAGRGSA
jgi:fermentation-respiration switch protein FrsA (DUF1100 family)